MRWKNWDTLLKNLKKSVKIEMFIGRKRGIQYEIQRKQAHRGGAIAE